LTITIVSIFLQRFFIGYWILKTGLDVYPGPFFFIYLYKYLLKTVLVLVPGSLAATLVAVQVSDTTKDARRLMPVTKTLPL
jgi:hypothetical protein